MTAETSSPSGSNFGHFNKQVNLSALLVTAILIFIGVKLLTLLPERYYFGFAKVVDPAAASSFLVQPPHIDPEQYAEILKRNGYSEYGMPVDSSGQPSATDIVDPDTQVKNINDEIHEAGRFKFWVSFLLKMLPPFVVSYFMFLIWKEEALTTAPLGAAFTAFLLAWPVIILWDYVVYGSWYDQRYLFFVLYLAYIVLYYHLARLGCILAKLTIRSGVVKAGKLEIDWGKILSSLFSTGVTAAITWIVTTAIARAG